MASSAAVAVHAAATPNSMSQLRACKSCHLIKSRRQFYSDGCDNCPHEYPSSSRAGEKEDYVQTRTSAAFTGTVAIMEPKISWVARQLQLQHYVDDDGRKIELKKGVYAVKLDDLVATGAEAGGMTQAADDYEDEEAHDDDEDDGFIAPHDTEEAGDEPEANEDLDDDGDDEEEEEEEFQSAIPPSSSSLAPADD